MYMLVLVIVSIHKGKYESEGHVEGHSLEYMELFNKKTWEVFGRRQKERGSDGSHEKDFCNCQFEFWIKYVAR